MLQSNEHSKLTPARTVRLFVTLFAALSAVSLYFWATERFLSRLSTAGSVRLRLEHSPPSSSLSTAQALQSNQDNKCVEEFSLGKHPLNYNTLVPMRVQTAACYRWDCCAALGIQQTRPRSAEDSELLTFTPNPRRLRGVYFGWVLENNLGDDILLDEFVVLLLNSLLEEVREDPAQSAEDDPLTARPRSQSRGNAFSRPVPAVEVSVLFSSDVEFECPVNASEAGLHFAALGGGSLLDPYYLLPYRALVQATGAAPFFFGSGFQELSPLPAPTLDHLLRSSFPIHMRTEALEFPPWFDDTFRGLLRHFSDGSTRVFGGIRGFATQRLLHYIGRAGGLPVLYDPGLLLQQLFFTPCRESIEPLLPQGFSLSAPFIIVNFLDVRDDPYFRGALVPSVVQVTGELACEFQVLVQSLAMYDMWLTREFLDSVRRAVPSRCGEAARARIFLSPFTTEYLAVTELFRLSAFSINVKLHANVLAAATTRPFVALGSRFKYMDFTETVHMSALTFNYHDGISPQQLQEAVTRMRRQYTHIRAELVSAVADGMERHRRAFAEFVRHLFRKHPEVARALRRSSRLHAKVVVFRSKRVVIDITGSD